MPVSDLDVAPPMSLGASGVHGSPAWSVPKMLFRYVGAGTLIVPSAVTGGTPVTAELDPVPPLTQNLRAVRDDRSPQEPPLGGVNRSLAMSAEAISAEREITIEMLERLRAWTSAHPED